jgi:glycosyltransferase involved in cell wall biosynthesis
MKIAVYTIALNEEQFVERWAESCKDADYRFVLDTGSTDKTVELAKSLNVITVDASLKPWRFDTARNLALSMLPADIDMCIALDMDEVLVEGWREHLEAVASNVTRPRYKYVWSWNSDGSEGLTYGGDKIHKRHGYTWKHPVHEVIKSVGGGEIQEWCGLEIHHHPDSSKSRGQYFDLLKLAVKEEPLDDRNQFYLAREYFFNNDYETAATHFKTHLGLSVWGPEKAASCRYLSRCEPSKRLYWLYNAVAEDCGRRENWFALMQYYYDIKDYAGLSYATNMGLIIKDKPLDYLCESDAWGWQFDDLAALGFHYTGDSDRALFYGRLALNANPDDGRLKSNMEFY